MLLSRYALWIFTSLLILTSCAAPKSPTGGPRDETPPQVVTTASTPNHQTNFRDKTITLTFDEWVELKDIYNQLIVSPLMPTAPDVKLKGKSVIITLPDSLKEETTYTLYFGNAIVDFTEGNVLENFSFVFSTGEILDSLRLAGVVTDAVSLKPAEGVWVMLHPAGLDSAVYKFKPQYLGKTDKSGRWSISNIRQDSFMVVALKDENLNFLYDQPTELFGWIDEAIYLTDSLKILPEIRVSPRPRKNLVREALHTVKGWLRLVVDAGFPRPEPNFEPPLEMLSSLWNGDTLHVWYQPDSAYVGKVIMGGDTTRIRAVTGTAQLDKNLNLVPITGRLHRTQHAVLASALPIDRIDVSMMKVVNDSLESIPFRVSVDSTVARHLVVKGEWQENSKNKFILLPGAITDIFDRSNDTLEFAMTIMADDQFSDLTLNISGLDSTRQYVVLIKSGEQVVERFVVQGQTNPVLNKSYILPAKYTVEIIEDLNGNGYWDTGDYDVLMQPEMKKFYSPEALRAAWEVAVDIAW